MKKLLLFFALAISSLFASELNEKVVENVQTALQVGGAGVAGLGVWRGVKTWNDPMSRELYRRLVDTYKQYLTECAPTISRFNRSGRIAYFKYLETCRQLIVPVLIFYAGASLCTQATLIKRAQQKEREIHEARLKKYFPNSFGK